MDALGDYERGEIFLTPAEEAAEAEAKEWFNDCAFHEAVQAIRAIIRAGKKDGFDAELFHEAVFEHMQGIDAWDQAEAAERTDAERREALHQSTKTMLGFE